MPVTTLPAPKQPLPDIAVAVKYNGHAVANNSDTGELQFDKIISLIWKELSKNLEINEAVVNATRLLSKFAPISQVLVRRIGNPRNCIETLAVGSPLPDYLLPETRTECTEVQLKELLVWCAEQKIAHRGLGKQLTGPLAWIVPTGIASDIIACSLGDSKNPTGVLLLIAKTREAFNEKHIALAQELVEPFSTALENAIRIRELAALRAAAEAEKNSLLTKLGRHELGDIVVGAGTGLKDIMDRVDLVARSDAPVIILGETGTGKEVIARLIHNKSSRTNGPFLRVNCGAIPPELIDSQLFGHEKGAFTGAVEARPGWFERADEGTLLLDEVGELPLAAQVRLLRILQDGWLERVGGQQPLHVNVRIIAATNRDLSSMVTSGDFREDLWYRIAVFPLNLPPLRNRKEDIPALAQHFAKRAASKFGLPPALPAPEDIHQLLSYSWPGNLRELGAVIDRASILGNGRRLEIAQALGSTIAPQSPNIEQPAAPVTPQQKDSLELDEVVRRHVQKVLAITHGRIEGRRGAADLLKINPHTLRARMRKLGINWAQFRPSEID